MTGRVKAGAALGVAVLGAGAAIAIGAVPDGNGVIHACYEVAPGGGTIPASGPNVRVIDTDNSQSCDPASEHAFTFGQQGPQGPQGATGPAGPQGAPGAIGTVENPAPAGHATVSYKSGSRARAVDTFAFDVLAIQVTVSRTGSAATGFVSRTRIVPPTLSVTLAEDQNTPKLVQFCASGKLLDTVVLRLVFGGGKGIETYTLSDAHVDSVRFGSRGGDLAPTVVADFSARSEKTQFSGTPANRLPSILFSFNRKVKLTP